MQPPPTALQQIILAMVVLTTGLIALYGLNLWALTLIAIFGKRRLPDPPKIGCWPKVSVHLPFYNEKRVAARILEACIKLDYPKDKLEIVVVDDSTDETTSIAKAYQDRYPGLIKVIHRGSRAGFKAGALKVALEESKGEFVALFDADYVPPTDFLKKMIPYMYVDEKIAFAQARWSYLDGEFSWMAKAVALAIDIWGLVDQKARYSANFLAHFNGTCGVFRRKAIEDVAGWGLDSLAEDLDLSVRLHLNGWKYVYVPNVVCPGEIPPTFKALRRQQYRWARGFSECLRKYWRRIVRSKTLTAFQKAEALIHLATYFISPLALVGMVLGMMYYLTFPITYWLLGFWRYKPALLAFGLSLIIYTAPLAASGATLWQMSKEALRQFRRILHLAYLGILTYALLPATTKGVLDGLLAKPNSFHRTPKVGYSKERVDVKKAAEELLD